MALKTYLRNSNPSSNFSVQADNGEKISMKNLLSKN